MRGNCRIFKPEKHGIYNPTFRIAVCPDSKQTRRLATTSYPYGPDDTTLVTNCDGACRGNGFNPSTATYGVYFATGSPFNKRGRIFSELRPTNNAGELFAIHQALETVLKNFDVSTLEKIVIATDSQYAIDCLTIWTQAWYENDWKNSKGKPVVNAELIDDIMYMIHQITTNGSYVYFWKVSRADNAEADELANFALLEPKQTTWVRHFHMCEKCRLRTGWKGQPVDGDLE